MKKFKSDYYSMAQSDYCCYLSDITVADKVEHRGIGKELIRLASRQLSDKCQLILLLSPSANCYYPKLGFIKREDAWVLSESEM